ARGQQQSRKRLTGFFRTRKIHAFPRFFGFGFGMGIATATHGTQQKITDKSIRPGGRRATSVYSRMNS
ncbi:hypothetical protein, partial [Burkholderia sp.]|uniref:hypothetical protein n=1 Tax=Burkholderia sp. TaxID=36773 RepID=UPI00258C98EF